MTAKLTNEQLNDRTHRIAQFSSFYPSPYLPFSKDYSEEGLTSWMKEIAELFIKLHDIKFTFDNPVTRHQLKLNALYYDLRTSFRQLAPDLRNELIPSLCHLFVIDGQESCDD